MQVRRKRGWSEEEAVLGKCNGTRVLTLHQVKILLNVRANEENEEFDLDKITQFYDEKGNLCKLDSEPEAHCFTFMLLCGSKHYTVKEAYNKVFSEI